MNVCDPGFLFHCLTHGRLHLAFYLDNKKRFSQNHWALLILRLLQQHYAVLALYSCILSLTLTLVSYFG